MPLDADDEPRGRAPRSPRSPRRAPTPTGAQAAAEPVDRLVVERVDRASRVAPSEPREPAARGEPSRRAWRTRSPGSRWRWSMVTPGRRSGRCWCSVPPRATLSACMPRQIARIGRPRASAARAARARSGRGRARSGRARGGGARRRSRGRGRGRRRGRCRSAAASSGSIASSSSGGITTGSPPAASIARRYVRPSAISRRGGSACGVCSTPLGEAHLRGRDADQRAVGVTVSTHVSLPPPFWELLTISEPRVERDPGEAARRGGRRRRPTPITNGRRSTWRGSSRPSQTVGWRRERRPSPGRRSRSGRAATSRRRGRARSALTRGQTTTPWPP